MELHLVSKLAKFRVFAVTLIGGAKKWFKSIPVELVTSWQQLSTSFLQHFQVTRKTTIHLAHLGNVKKKKGVTLKFYIDRFNDMSKFVTWSPDVGILAHLMNEVLIDTPFWDELLQKECQSVDEFYRKARKYLKLKDSKKALSKIERTTTGKKNDPGTAVDGQKGQEASQEPKETEKWSIREQKATLKVYQLSFSHSPAKPRLCYNGQKSL